MKTLLRIFIVVIGSSIHGMEPPYTIKLSQGKAGSLIGSFIRKGFSNTPGTCLSIEKRKEGCDFLRTIFEKNETICDTLREYRATLEEDENKFFKACITKDENVVGTFLKNGHSILNALYEACNNLEMGSQTYSWLEAFVKKQNMRFEQPELDIWLRRACQHSSKVPFAQFLIENGANVHQITHHGTLLHELIGKQKDTCFTCQELHEPLRESVFDLLLSHRADPNATDSNNETPLFYAQRHHRFLAPQIRLLLLSGANMHHGSLRKEKETPFLDAAYTYGVSNRQNAGPLTEYLQFCPKSDKQGKTALHHLLYFLLQKPGSVVDNLPYIYALQLLIKEHTISQVPDQEGMTVRLLFRQFKEKMTAQYKSNDPKMNELMDIISSIDSGYINKSPSPRRPPSPNRSQSPLLSPKVPDQQQSPKRTQSPLSSPKLTDRIQNKGS